APRDSRAPGCTRRAARNGRVQLERLDRAQLLAHELLAHFARRYSRSRTWCRYITGTSGRSEAHANAHYDGWGRSLNPAQGQRFRSTMRIAEQDRMSDDAKFILGFG